MKCRICNKEAGDKVYCRSHMKAHKNIIREYRNWSKAIGISWKEYLSEIAKNPSTGEWVREVAECLMADGEELDVKNR